MKSFKLTAQGKLFITLSIALSIIPSIAAANWCTGKDYYLIEMELADRLIKGQEEINKQQKAIYRTQLQLRYDDKTPAITLKKQLHSAILRLQKQTQKYCLQNGEKTNLRLQVTQLIHYKQLHSRLDKLLSTHKTIGNELIHANNELQVAHSALQAKSQSLSEALNTISAACLTVKYSKKTIDKFQSIDVKSIKDSQNNVEHLQAVMDQYQLLSLPSNALCDSFSKYGLKIVEQPSSWWKKLF